MDRCNLTIVVYCTVVSFGVLYTTQPLLPLLAAQWGRPMSDTALLTTATMAFILSLCALLVALTALGLMLRGARVQLAAEDLHEQTHDVAKHR